jgi:hypothetical protein
LLDENEILINPSKNETNKWYFKINFIFFKFVVIRGERKVKNSEKRFDLTVGFSFQNLLKIKLKIVSKDFSSNWKLIRIFSTNLNNCSNSLT